MHEIPAYHPKHTIRIVTAASLFDGHDAAINIMRRIIQSSGAEVIHLGHNRSVKEVVDCAIQEDVQAIAMTSYQGGHIEYFKYMYDLLREGGAPHIKIFAGGGGTILPTEIDELHAYGISRVYSPDDGREMGLQGMINDLLEKSDYVPPSASPESLLAEVQARVAPALAKAISGIEHDTEEHGAARYWNELAELRGRKGNVLGITGTGGAGKSSLTDELVRRFLADFPDKSIAIISVDPSKRKTGGALLGDRIRMNAVSDPRVYMRSFATKEANVALNKNVRAALDVLHVAAFDLIIVETAGIGQSDSQITEVADVSMYVMTPEYGAATQLEKIDMIDYADLIALNKSDKRGALDAIKDVKKQVQRSRKLWDTDPDKMPVYASVASQFNDPGTNRLYRAMIDRFNEKTSQGWESSLLVDEYHMEKQFIIPPDRVRYLSEIVDENRRYDRLTLREAEKASALYRLKGSLEILGKQKEM